MVRFPFKEKNRTGVVLYADDEDAVVLIHGTGTRRDLPSVEVQPGSREGKMLGLYKPTYFYPSAVLVVRREILTVIGSCPPDLFLRLRAIAAQT